MATFWTNKLWYSYASFCCTLKEVRRGGEGYSGHTKTEGGVKDREWIDLFSNMIYCLEDDAVVGTTPSYSGKHIDKKVNR